MPNFNRVRGVPLSVRQTANLENNLACNKVEIIKREMFMSHDLLKGSKMLHKALCTGPKTSVSNPSVKVTSIFRMTGIF